MTILDVGQEMAQTLHAVDVLVSVRDRLEGSGWALYVFHRLSLAELDLLVWQETHEPLVRCPQATPGTVAA